MNETLLKSSILKKTAKNRDSLNATPSSNKSVRFQGVEFMVITDEASERGSYFDEDMSIDGSSRHYEEGLKSSVYYSSLPANARINLFRVNQDSMQNTTIRGSCIHPPFQSRVPRELSANSCKWSQAFTKTSSLKPPTYPKFRTQNQRINSGNSTNASQRLNSGSTLTSQLIINKTTNNRPLSSSTNDSTNSTHFQKSPSLTQITGIASLAHPLTSIQPPQSLSLYSYLLQNKIKANDREIINPSMMRSQTKKITCEELNVKPFTPRIKSTNPNTIGSSSLRMTHSSPTLKDYFQNPSEAKTLTVRSSRNLGSAHKKGGVIHVNAQNLTYLRTDNKNGSITNEANSKPEVSNTV